MKKDWEIKKLGDLFEITSSKRVFQSEWEKGGVPFYRAREIVKLAQQGYVNNELFISPEMYERYSTKYGIPKPGDIMVTGVGTLGICYVVQVHDRFYFKDGNIIWLKKNTNTNSRYVEYAFKSDYLRKQIDNSMGATVGTYTIIKAKNTVIPIPPLPEQHRIVTILDEAFAAVATAKANAEKNLKNARELFESYLQSVFANKGEGWEEKKLDDIIESNVIGLIKNTHEQRDNYKYKYVKMNNITRDNCFDLSKYTCVNATDVEVYKYSLAKNDFLFNTRNSYELVGKTCLFEGFNDEVILYNNNIMRIRFQKSINPLFINYSFKTKRIIEKLANIKNGTTNVSAIYYKDLKNITLLIPSIREQFSIETKLNVLAARTKELESIYKQKLADLDELKKSILQKAFNGELNGVHS